MKKLNLSLCCLLREKASETNLKTMTVKRFRDLSDVRGPKHALEELENRIVQNFLATKAIIEFCIRNDIQGYRISSSLVPVITHDDIDIQLADLNRFAEIQKICKEISYLVSGSGLRLSCHPSQYVVLASKNPDSVRRSIKELELYGFIMDMMGCKRSHWNPINLHLNASTKEPTTHALREICERFCLSFASLSSAVSSRLTIENEDKGCWNTDRLCNVFNQCVQKRLGRSVPICFDNLHERCNPSGSYTQRAMFELALSTWGMEPPLFHFSESKWFEHTPRSHADMPTSIPQHYGNPQVYFDVELKSKEEAIAKIRKMEKES